MVTPLFLKKTALSLLLATTASLCGTHPGEAADKKKTTQTVKAATVATTPPPAPPAPLAATPSTVAPTAIQTSVNSITQSMVKGGVLACTSRINQVANFLTGGNKGVGAFLFLPPTDQDQRLVSFSVEIPAATGPVAYASASFAPNQANGCGGMYETVSYWPQGCSAVATGTYGSLKQNAVLAKDIMVLDGGSMTRIFLLPAGTGCVSIKKEIVL